MIHCEALQLPDGDHQPGGVFADVAGNGDLAGQGAQGQQVGPSDWRTITQEDIDEFAKSPFAFKTFNEFFYRALKPEARPIAAGSS